MLLVYKNTGIVREDNNTSRILGFIEFNNAYVKVEFYIIEQNNKLSNYINYSCYVINICKE